MVDEFLKVLYYADFSTTSVDVSVDEQSFGRSDHFVRFYLYKKIYKSILKKDIVVKLCIQVYCTTV